MGVPFVSAWRDFRLFFYLSVWRILGRVKWNKAGYIVSINLPHVCLSAHSYISILYLYTCPLNLNGFSDCT
jgi:hypothetical protein